MKVLNESELEILNSTGASVALGTFDGLHIGHRTIIDMAKRHANGMPVVCCTFENIPASLFIKDRLPVFTPKEKLDALLKMGVDYVFMPRFTSEFAEHSSIQFLDFLRDNMHAKVLCAGFNYTFGYKASGNSQAIIDYANKNGIQAYISKPVSYEGQPVSSTRIRNALFYGDIKNANAMLSSPFTLSGTVICGKKLGRTIGFPTVNFYYPENKTPLKRGVYVTRVNIAGVYYPAITNIGVRPTVENTKNVNVETNIIGFSGDLYGKEVAVEFFSYIREEKRFSGIEELSERLEKDKKIALQYDFTVLK